MRYEEPSEHCLCDNCSGQDCGQDNPEEYKKELERERSDIRQAERERVLIALKRDLRTRFISSSNQWSKGRNAGLIECCNTIDELLRQEGNREKHSKDIGNVSKEDMIFTPVRHVDGE